MGFDVGGGGMMTDWLQNLKAGDRVAVSRNWGRGPEIRKVSRTTKAQIFIDGSAFWKKDGWSVGSSSGWHGKFLIQVTPKLELEIIEENKRAKALNLARNCDTSALSMDKVEALIALLDEGKV
jgi:hypothetical protein